MAVSEFVTFQIQVNNAGVARQGFGTPLVLSYNATWPEVVRTYAQYADVLVDFAAGTPEAVAANALFAQGPHPQTVKIGRGALKPTLVYTMAAAAVRNSFGYKVQVDGPGVTSTESLYTSDSTATTQEIHNGLVTQLNAVTGKNYTATFSPLVYTSVTFTADSTTDQLHIVAHGLNTGDGPLRVSNAGGGLPAPLLAATDYYVVKVDADNIKLSTTLANALAGTIIDITTNGTGTQTLVQQAGQLSPILPFIVTGSAVGNWFSLEVRDVTAISNKMTHADPGVATDLAAIQLADSDWYGLVSMYPSKGVVLAESAWVETNGKIYLPSVPETEAISTTTGNGDTGDTLLGLGYKRTDAKYHPSPLQCFSGASLGIVIPRNPGTWTEAYKTLAGVSPVKLNATQRVNLRARRMGSYTTEKGRNITWDGKVGSTVYGYLDITVAIDWLTDAVQSAAFGVLVSLDKVSYTDEDIDLIAGAIRGVLHDAVSDSHRILDPGNPADPLNLPPQVSFPKVADISSGTRALRKLPNGTITGRLQGAVQFVDFTATVTF